MQLCLVETMEAVVHGQQTSHALFPKRACKQERDGSDNEVCAVGSSSDNKEETYSFQLIIMMHPAAVKLIIV